MSIQRLFILVIALSTTLLHYSKAQSFKSSTTDLSPSYDKIFRSIDSMFLIFDKPSIPAIEVAIVKKGKLIYSKGLGSADIEGNVPATLETNFNIASNSKQFTALCIMLLEEKGKLNRTDDIRNYLPEMPDYGKTITINHLLYHTSGIRDYLELQELMCKADFNQKSILELIAKQRNLNFEPGECHLYSNSNYFLLGIIIERVSGYSLHRFIRDNIFIPLGMKNTFFSEEKTVTNEAKAYRKSNDTYLPEENRYPVISGAGGIISNAKDLILWDQNFYHNILGEKREKLIDDLLTTGKLNSSDNTYYAGGLFNIQYKDKQAIFHGGGYHSYATQILRFPEDSLSIILLSAMQIRLDFYCFKIADLFIGGEPQNIKVTRHDNMPSENISGYYFNQKLLNYFLVEQTDSCLIGNRRHYYKVAENDYISDDDVWGWKNYLSFKTTESGDIEINHKVVYISDTYKRIKEEALNAGVAGKYYCPELANTSFELRFGDTKPAFLVDGKYIAEVTTTFGDIGLIPIFSAVIHFERNAQNQVTGFTLSTDRVKKLQFVKK